MRGGGTLKYLILYLELFQFNMAHLPEWDVKRRGGWGGGGNHTISCSDQCDNGGWGCKSNPDSRCTNEGENRVGWLANKRFEWARRRNQVGNFLVPKVFRKVEITMISLRADQSTHPNLKRIKQDQRELEGEILESKYQEIREFIFSHFSHCLQWERLFRKSANTSPSEC